MSKSTKPITIGPCTFTIQDRFLPSQTKPRESWLYGGQVWFWRCEKNGVEESRSRDFDSADACGQALTAFVKMMEGR